MPLGVNHKQKAVRSRVADLTEPESWHELAGQTLKTDKHGFLWRGQADYTWPLASKLQRLLRDSNLLGQGGDIEVHALLEFQRLATPLLDKPPDAGDHVHWLALMRHFGGPTRLLDWTFSPRVAIFHAYADEASRTQDGALWFFDVNAMMKPELMRGYRTPQIAGLSALEHLLRITRTAAKPIRC